MDPVPNSTSARISVPAGDVRVRPAVSGDAEPINRIYNHYVRETSVTFDLEESSLDTRVAWVGEFAETGRHRLLVAERAGDVVGYACTRTFRPKAAYATTVETSVYCDPDQRGHGIGHRLYADLFDALESEDVNRFVAGVTLPNPASEALHRRFGFVPVGLFSEVGRKFGRYWDVRWYERRNPRTAEA